MGKKIEKQKIRRNEPLLPEEAAEVMRGTLEVVSISVEALTDMLENLIWNMKANITDYGSLDNLLRELPEATGRDLRGLVNQLKEGPLENFIAAGKVARKLLFQFSGIIQVRTLRDIVQEMQLLRQD